MPSMGSWQITEGATGGVKGLFKAFQGMLGVWLGNTRKYRSRLGQGERRVSIICHARAPETPGGTVHQTFYYSSSKLNHRSRDSLHHQTARFINTINTNPTGPAQDSQTLHRPPPPRAPDKRATGPQSPAPDGPVFASRRDRCVARYGPGRRDGGGRLFCASGR